MIVNIRDYAISKDALPNNLLLRGLVYLIIALIFSFIILFIFPLQEKIIGEAFIYKSGIPHTIITPKNGTLFLNVNSSEHVSKNQILGCINWNLSSVDLEKIDNLIKYNPDYKSASSLSRLRTLVRSLENVEAVDLRSYIYSIENSLNQFSLLLAANNPDRMIQSLEKEIDQKERVIKKINASKKPLLSNESVLAAQYLTDKKLFSIGAISERDMQLGKTKVFENNIRIKEVDIQIEQQKLEILKLQSDQTRLESNFDHLTSNFQSKVSVKLEEFERYFLDQLDENQIKATSAGKISIPPNIKNQMQIEQHTEILKIIPQSQGKFEERNFIVIDINRNGDIIQGQKVFIDLQDYNSNEYGVIEAVVKNKSSVPYGDKYYIEIDLKNGLTTSLNIKLPKQSLYNGTAEILIRKKTIAHNIMDEVIAKISYYKRT